MTGVVITGDMAIWVLLFPFILIGMFFLTAIPVWLIIFLTTECVVFTGKREIRSPRVWWGDRPKVRERRRIRDAERFKAMRQYEMWADQFDKWLHDLQWDWDQPRVVATETMTLEEAYTARLLEDFPWVEPDAAKKAGKLLARGVPYESTNLDRKHLLRRIIGTPDRAALQQGRARERSAR